jgi:hypothetical protein
VPSVIQWLCDVHYADDVSVPGESVEIVIDKRPRVIILCEECRERLVDPLATVLDEHGVTPSKTDRSPGSTSAAAQNAHRRAADLPQGMDVETARALLQQRRCIFTPTHGPFSSVAYALAHIRQAHGTTASELGVSGRGGSRGTGLTAIDREQRHEHAPHERHHTQTQLDDDAAQIAQSGRVVGETPPIIAAAQLDGDDVPTCTICSRTFANKAGLGGHMSNVHGIKSTAEQMAREAREQAERRRALGA